MTEHLRMATLVNEGRSPKRGFDHSLVAGREGRTFSRGYGMRLSEGILCVGRDAGGGEGEGDGRLELDSVASGMKT